jgi:hypothetical protein
MHPHQNPVYQSNLLNCFIKCYHNQTLKIKPEADETAYKKEERMQVYKLLTLQCTGIAGCFYVDSRFFSRVAHYTKPRRFVYFAAGVLLATRLAIDLSKSQTKIDLANKLALKYEIELLEINPQLRAFYLPSVEIAVGAASVGRAADDTREDWGTSSSQKDWRGNDLERKDSTYEQSHQGYSYGAPETSKRSDD